MESFISIHVSCIFKLLVELCFLEDFLGENGYFLFEQSFEEFVVLVGQDLPFDGIFVMLGIGLSFGEELLVLVDFDEEGRDVLGEEE